MIHGDFLVALMNGLALGCLIGLLAVGYSLVYGVARLINFAHGDLLALGGYYMLFLLSRSPIRGASGVLIFMAGTVTVAGFAYGKRFRLAGGWRITFSVILGLLVLIGGLFKEGRSVPPLLAVATALIMTAIAGVAFEYAVYRPLAGAPRLSYLVAAIGLSLFLEGSMQLLFGTERRSFPPEIQTALARLPVPSFLAGLLSGLDLMIIASTLVVTLIAAVLAKRSAAGIAIRAVAEAPLLAARLGINVRAARVQVFAAGAGLAGLSAFFFVARQSILEPTIGYSQGIVAFCAAVIGGIGRLSGALLGGLFIGMILSLLPLIHIAAVAPVGWRQWLPSSELSDWGLGLVYLMMALILAIRPRGLVTEEHWRDI